MRLPAAAALAVLALGCGGRPALPTGDGGGGDAAGDGATDQPADGRGFEAPPDTSADGEAGCAVVTAMTPPFGVTLRFTNTSTTTVYMRQECGPQYAISSCETGFGEAISIHPPCEYCQCNQCSSCAVCGGCAPSRGIAIAMGSDQMETWMGYRYERQVSPPLCATPTCWEAKSMPAARYRVSVPVYPSDSAATAGSPPPRMVTRDFDLPAAGVVTVDLAP